MSSSHFSGVRSLASVFVENPLPRLPIAPGIPLWIPRPESGRACAVRGGRPRLAGRGVAGGGGLASGWANGGWMVRGGGAAREGGLAVGGGGGVGPGGVVSAGGDEGVVGAGIGGDHGFARWT